jgi:hypothetical protein
MGSEHFKNWMLKWCTDLRAFDTGKADARVDIK